MNTKLFRKKNLDKIASPDSMDTFLRVTNPSTWISLAALLVLLVGAIGWAVFGTIESKTTGVITANELSTTCYISEKDITRVTSGMEVRVDEEKYTITDISTKAVVSDIVLSDYATQLGGYSSGEYVYPASLDRTLSPGSYKCEIIIEVLNPIDFLSN